MFQLGFVDDIMMAEYLQQAPSGYCAAAAVFGGFMFIALIGFMVIIHYDLKHDRDKH